LLHASLEHGARSVALASVERQHGVRQGHVDCRYGLTAVLDHTMNLPLNRDISPDAFRLAAKLETYEAHLDTPLAIVHDRGRWRAAWRDLQQIVAMAHALPQLAVEITDIVRGHLRLLASIAANAAPRQHEREQRLAIALLHEKCVALVRQ
jgi:hypothetical protein